MIGQLEEVDCSFNAVLILDVKAGASTSVFWICLLLLSDPYFVRLNCISHAFAYDFHASVLLWTCFGTASDLLWTHFAQRLVRILINKPLSTFRTA